MKCKKILILTEVVGIVGVMFWEVGVRLYLQNQRKYLWFCCIDFLFLCLKLWVSNVTGVQQQTSVLNMYCNIFISIFTCSLPLHEFQQHKQIMSHLFLPFLKERWPFMKLKTYFSPLTGWKAFQVGSSLVLNEHSESEKNRKTLH